MRNLQCTITDMRKKVFAEVAKLAYEGGDYYTRMEKLPYELMPGEVGTVRESIFLERAIVGERIRLAMGLPLRDVSEHTLLSDGVEESAIAEKYYDPPLINIIKYACHACPDTHYEVTNACQGCLARHCSHACPKGAIYFEHGQAHIDQTKCIKCGKCKAACSYQAIIKFFRPCQEACGMDAIGKDDHGRAQINYDKCVNCGMCLVNCPFGAIVDKGQLFQLIHAIKKGEKVIAIIAPAFWGQFGEKVTPGQIKAAMKELGFAGLEEVAVGADLDRLHRPRPQWGMLGLTLALLLVGVTGFTPSVLRAAGAVWLSALGVWVYGPPDALTSLGVAGVLMTAGNSYAVCDVGFQLSFAAVVGTLAGGAVVRRSQEAWEKQRAKKKRPRLRFWKRKALGLAGSLWETVCISACASMATFPVLVLRGMSTSLYALVSGAAVLWLVEPILLTGLGAALLGLAPALAPAQRVCSCCAEFLAEVLGRWALWVSGWPGAQIWFDTAYAAVVCLLLAGLCWLAFHNRVRLRVALPALLLTAGLAVFTGNALSRDVVRVELVGSRNAPAVVISRKGNAVILFRGGDVTRSAVETTLERRNIRTVECLIDLRLRPRSAQRMGAEQRIAVDRMALYATRHVRCGPAEVEVLRTRNGCVARIHAAGQTFVTLSGSAALAAPVQADYLLASPARPDCVKYDAILSLSSDYRWMPEAFSSGRLCHSFSRAE